MSHVKRHGRVLNIILGLLLLFISCGDQSSTGHDQTAVEAYCPLPALLNDGWEVGRLHDVGLDSVPIINMLKEIERWDIHRFNGILIVKDGKLVFEKYYPGHVFDFNIPGLTATPMQYDATTRHYLASQSKSVTSLLFGIAMDRGDILNVDDRIETYFAPEYSSNFQNGKELITIKHLLTMSSGLPWNENPPATGDMYQLFTARDPIQYILTQSLESTPGQRFHYNSGSTNLLGEIVRRRSAQNLLQFARANLFTPLGISNIDLKIIRGETYFASGGFFLTPRDMAKIGQLCLNGGVWNGRTIVSKQWLEESTRSWIYPTEFGMGNGYGYQWWMNEFTAGGKQYHAYFAAGWGEQLMFVFPTEKMIVLFFGEYYTTGPRRSVHSLMADYILASVKR